uniref:NAP1- protein 2 n=1 Tax=Sphaerodactylus townsendi TaxID=933632 RepID=A0ACB8G0K5_9SAUR
MPCFSSIADYLDLDKNGSLFPSNSPLTPKVDKEKSWLYTLDPILVTIIAMSSLGVLLGAICAGLLLYCTCSYTGLSSRSSTTLENYNFELYDGIKHKEERRIRPEGQWEQPLLSSQITKRKREVSPRCRKKSPATPPRKKEKSLKTICE